MKSAWFSNAACFNSRGRKTITKFFCSRFLHICNTELFCLMVNTLFLSIEVSLKMLNSAGNNSSSDLVSVYLKVFDL